ncbi:MAG: hypothetical protein JAZ17_07770 [Candidatus Thiodiazotropha endolucinida]|nr:hypothetical protein [Candidatus Thiodiazotropha endolucinida]
MKSEKIHNYLRVFLYFLVCGVSFFASYYLQTTEIMSSVLAAPGVIALIGAVFQLIRDEAAHERNKQLQQSEFQFSLGAASHMAIKAFDKHVEFCEQYIEEVQDAVYTLFSKGTTPEALEHARNLYKLREKYVVWLNDDINKSLGDFEKNLRRLGANAHFEKQVRGIEAYAENKKDRIEKQYNLLFEITGIGIEPTYDEQGDIDDDTHKSGVEAVTHKVKDILGIEDLLKIRKQLIFKASDMLSL